MVAAGTTLPTATTTIASRDYFKTLADPAVSRDVLRRPRHRRRRPARRRQPGVRVAVSRDEIRSARASGSPAAADHRAWSEIVGVVGDARNNGAAAPARPESIHPDGAGTRRLEPVVPAGRGRPGCRGAGAVGARPLLRRSTPSSRSTRSRRWTKRSRRRRSSSGSRRCCWRSSRWRWCSRRSAFTA